MDTDDQWQDCSGDEIPDTFSVSQSLLIGGKVRWLIGRPSVYRGASAIQGALVTAMKPRTLDVPVKIAVEMAR